MFDDHKLVHDRPLTPPTFSQNSIILYIVCIVLAVVLVLVILISVVCYVRVRRRSGNQKPINMVALPPGKSTCTLW